MADAEKPPEPADDDQPVDDRTVELISYLDGELSPEEADEVEARIGKDSKLRNEVDTLKRAWDLLDFLPKREPSPNFTEKTISHVMPMQNLPPTGSSQSRTPAMSPPRPSSSSAVVAVLPPAINSSQKLARTVAVLAAMLLLATLGWFLQKPIQQAFFPREEKNPDAQLLADMRILENLKYYRHIEDFAFLQNLDHPELFSEEPFPRD